MKKFVAICVLVFVVSTGIGYFIGHCSLKPVVKSDQSVVVKPPAAPVKPKIVEIDRSGTPKFELMATPVDIKLRNEPGTKNAKRAAELVDGAILKPGEVFSYNEKIGERTLAKGFVEGTLPIKKEDGTIENIRSVGSGVCRLSVGLATEVKRAGLKQIEITPHAIIPYYFETNKDQNLVDSTIYWGNGPQPLIDNKFQNNKDFDIQIKCSVDNASVLHVSFYKVSYLK